MQSGSRAAADSKTGLDAGEQTALETALREDYRELTEAFHALKRMHA